MESLVNMNEVNSNFWKNKKVFLTGHTGFKGSWLSIWLHHMGALVKGLSLRPKLEPNLFSELRVQKFINSNFGDIRDLEIMKECVHSFSPEIVFHLAAQPLVRESYEDPIETYSTNLMGTLNLLEVIRNCDSVKAVVIITTDKCYENKEWVWGYRENEPMGGHDPYSSSKGCCELLVSSYRRSFFQDSTNPAVATARAGNVIGGGDWAKDRLIPDVIRVIENSEKVNLRNPNSIRPWQHVLDPLSGYLMLGEKLFSSGQSFAEAWNFGPKDEDCKSVSYVLDKIYESWGKNKSWEEDNSNNPHEAELLKLDCSKARSRLSWESVWGLDKAIEMVVDWHKSKIEGHDVLDKTINQINEYTKNY